MSPPARARPLERLTLDGTLATVAPFAPPALVSDDAWSTVRRAASMLPAALTRATYLECRLAGRPAPVDLILRVERDGAALLAGLNPGARLSPRLRGDPAWSAVAALCARWLADDGPLERLVSHLWLEFDLAPGATGSIPRPSVFAGLRAGAAAGVDERDAAALIDWLGGAAPAGLDVATRAAALALLARGAPGLRIPYVGVMAAREVPAVRVYFRGPAAAQVPGTLAGAGWPGPVDVLAEALGELSTVPGAPPVGMLHVDVAAEILPRAGVEFVLAREPQLHGHLDEAAFLERLVGMGLCTPAGRDGLLAWPGARRCALPHELWESVMVRRVNCVKLVCGHDGLEAKGYLLAFQLPAPPTRRGDGE